MPTPLKPVRTVAPASPLITLAEARVWCHEDSTDQDALLQLLIDAATSELDGMTGILGRCLIAQTWRFDFDSFAHEIRLPLAPLIAVTSVSWKDAPGASQTVAPTVYHAVEDALSPVVRLASGQSWPTPAIRPDAVSITAQLGYGASATDVPGGIRFAAQLAIADGYANREAQIVGTIVAESLTRNRTLAGFRRLGL